MAEQQLLVDSILCRGESKASLSYVFCRGKAFAVDTVLNSKDARCVDIETATFLCCIVSTEGNLSRVPERREPHKTYRKAFTGIVSQVCASKHSCHSRDRRHIASGCFSLL